MFSAITYPVASGHEEEVAEIFSMRNFIRADSPVIRDANDRKIGRIIGTGLFIRDVHMVRIIQYEGQLTDVARHMSGQRGVQQAERKLAPLLTVPRDTRTEAGFLDYFIRSSMHTSVADVLVDTPVDGLIALCDVLRPDIEPALLDRWLDRAWRLRVPGVLASLAFRLGDTLIRAVQYSGDQDDLIAALAADDGLDRERELDAFRRQPRLTGSADFAELIAASQMRCISLLSVASLLKA